MPTHDDRLVGLETHETRVRASGSGDPTFVCLHGLVDDLTILIERKVVVDPDDHDFVGEGLRETFFERLLGHP